MDYYFIDKSNQRQGPIPEEELCNYDILPTTYVWCKGMDGWQKAESVPGLTDVIKFRSTSDEGENKHFPEDSKSPLKGYKWGDGYNDLESSSWSGLKKI